MIQLRSEETGMQLVGSLEAAFKLAKKDSSIWKISFDLGTERVRLVWGAVRILSGPRSALRNSTKF